MFYPPALSWANWVCGKDMMIFGNKQEFLLFFSTEIWSLLDFLILDPRKFNRFSIENGNIVWGKNWDLMFPIEQLHDGVLL